MLTNEWHKSTDSGYNGNCVEAKARPGPGTNPGDLGEVTSVDVRDSKDVDGPVLTFSTGEWRAFLAEQKAARDAGQVRNL